VARVDAADVDSVDDFRLSRVKTLRGWEGLDMVVDTVGDATLVPAAIETLGVSRTICVYFGAERGGGAWCQCASYERVSQGG